MTDDWDDEDPDVGLSHNPSDCPHCHSLDSYLSAQLYFCEGQTTALDSAPYECDGILYVVTRDGTVGAWEQQDEVSEYSPIGLQEARARAIRDGWILDPRAPVLRKPTAKEDPNNVGDAMDRLAK